MQGMYISHLVLCVHDILLLSYRVSLLLPMSTPSARSEYYGLPPPNLSLAVSLNVGRSLAVKLQLHQLALFPFLPTTDGKPHGWISSIRWFASVYFPSCLKTCPGQCLPHPYTLLSHTQASHSHHLYSICSACTPIPRGSITGTFFKLYVFRVWLYF